MGDYWSIFQNSLFSIGAQIIYRASNALLFIFIANQLGETDAGIYTLGLAYFLICSRLSFFGLDILLTREAAKQPTLLPRYFITFGAFRLTTSTLLTLAVTAFLLLGRPYETATSTVLLIMLAGIIPENMINLNLGCFTSREEVYWSSLTFGVNGVTKLIAGLFIIFFTIPLTGVALVFLLSQILTMIISTIIVIRRYIDYWEWPSFSLIKKTIVTSSSFFIISSFYVLDNRFDNIILSWFQGETELGIYSLAFNVVSIFLIIPSGLRTAILPILAKQIRSQNPHETLTDIYLTIYRYLLWLGFPISVALLLLARPVLQLLYRNPPLTAETALQLMGIAAFGMFINVLNTQLLVAQNRQGWVAVSLIGSMIVNISLNIFLVPSWGALGSAIARAISFLILFTCNSLVTIPYFQALRLWHIYRPPLLASIVMGGILHLLIPITTNLITLVFLGFLSFCFTLWILGGITTKEHEFATQILTYVRHRLRPRSDI